MGAGTTTGLGGCAGLCHVAVPIQPSPLVPEGVHGHFGASQLECTSQGVV